MGKTVTICFTNNKGGSGKSTIDNLIRNHTGDNGMAADFFDRTFNFICEHLAA